MAVGVNLSFTKAIIDTIYNTIKVYASYDTTNRLIKDDIKDIVNTYADVFILDTYKEIRNDQYTNLQIEGINRICKLFINTDQINPEKILECAIESVKSETHQAMESLVHNLNTMQSRAGSQCAFSSLNYGTDTTDAGRLVIDEILNAIYEGMGNGETAIFPISIFRVKDGINFKPGDPNYDLYKKSMRVSAKRLFPNWEFLDAPFNLQYYVEGKPETYVATMGCVDYNEIITYQYNNITYIEHIGYAYDRLSNYFTTNACGNSKYLNTDGNVKILDTNYGGFVNCKKFIMNPVTDNEWHTIILSDGNSIKATRDHPLPVKGVGRVYVCNLRLGYEIPVVTNESKIDYKKIVEIVITPASDTDRCYDVETDSDRFDVSGINSHNCRTRVIGNVNGPQISHKRGNLSFTSINLPRLGILHRNDINGFYEHLHEMLELVRDQLLERMEFQGKKKVRNFPFLMGEGLWLDSEKLGPDDTLQDVIKHGTLSIGFIGLAECLKALIGKHHGESEEAQKLGLEIVGYMRKFCDDMSKQYKLNFTLLGTPAEGLSGRFLNIDRTLFGIIPGVTDREYYTNSSHCPVYYPISAYDKVSIEAPYHALENAGHIGYIELDGDVSKNIDAMEELLSWMKECGMGYVSINHPVDHDPVCGYTGIINDVCPRCGRKDGEGVSLDTLKKFGLYKNVNMNTIGYHGDINEELDRIPNYMRGTCCDGK